MPRILVAYALTLMVFLLIDFLWLSLVARRFYANQLQALMLDRPRLGVAALFYIIFCVGLLVFAVLPGLARPSGMHAALMGALLGLVAYATYDLSNLATLKGWPWRMSLLDIAWGTALGGVSAFGGYWLTRMTPFAS